MDSVLNISEGEMGIVHYFLALTMSLMYLIAGPSTDSSFSRQSWHSVHKAAGREAHRERRERERVVVVRVGRGGPRGRGRKHRQERK